MINSVGWLFHIRKWRGGKQWADLNRHLAFRDFRIQDSYARKIRLLADRLQEPFHFQYRMCFPSAMRPTDSAHNLPAFDLARFAVLAAGIHEASHPNLHASSVLLRARLPVEYSCARIGSRRQFAAIYRLPGNVNRLEAEPLRRDLDGHKAAVLVVAGGEIR